MYTRNISFCERNERKKQIITKALIHERKVHIKKKGKVHIMNFSDKEKVDIINF